MRTLFTLLLSVMILGCQEKTSEDEKQHFPEPPSIPDMSIWHGTNGYISEIDTAIIIQTGQDTSKPERTRRRLELICEGYEYDMGVSIHKHPELVTYNQVTIIQCYVIDKGRKIIMSEQTLYPKGFREKIDKQLEILMEENNL